MDKNSDTNFLDLISHCLKFEFHAINSEVNPSKLYGCTLELLCEIAYLKSSSDFSHNPLRMKGLYFLKVEV